MCVGVYVCVFKYQCAKKTKHYECRIIYPVKISSKNEGKIKWFSDKNTERDLVSSRLALKGNASEYSMAH